MSRRIWIGILVASVLCVSLETRARADVPSFLTQQGRLFDSNNQPVTGMTTFVFSIYPAATGGTAVWTETQMITLDSGYFSAQLGEVTTLSPTIFVNAASMMPPQTLYLGIKVNTDAELSPRQPLLSVPYAMVASNAIGDITPHTVSVNGKQVIDSMGNWVGPAMGGGHPVMKSGFNPPPAQGASLKQSVVLQGLVLDPANWQWGATFTSAELTGATSCQVTATAQICGHPAPSVNGFPIGYAAARQTGNQTTAVTSPEGAWMSPPFVNSGANTLTCSAGTTASTFSLTAGVGYDFGCAFSSAVAVAGYTGTPPNTDDSGAYCQVSVVCF
jgi:hypothetical protein